MLENGLKKAFSDFISVLSARQQPHLYIFALDLACNHPLKGDLCKLPVCCDAGDEEIKVGVLLIPLINKAEIGCH